MARVGLDIDGVLYPFEDSLRLYLRHARYISEEQALEEYPPAQTWDFFKAWRSEKSFDGPMGRDEFNTLCHTAVDAKWLFWKGVPYPGTTQAMHRLREAGHEIILITARNYGAVGMTDKATRAWLETWDLPYDELHTNVRDKTLIDVDYYIDDKYENFAAVAGESGAVAFLMDRPWNRKADYSMDRWRVFNLNEYVDRVEAAESKRIILDVKPSFTPSETVNEILHDYVEARVKEYEELDARVERIVTNEKTGGQKGTKLARFDLIPAKAMWEVAELYGKGAEKYDDNNWRLGYDWKYSIGALERHHNLFKQGIDYDNHEPDCPEDCTTHTGMHHLTSVIFHALGLLTFKDEHPELDDRFKP